MSTQAIEEYQESREIIGDPLQKSQQWAIADAVYICYRCAMLYIPEFSIGYV